MQKPEKFLYLALLTPSSGPWRVGSDPKCQPETRPDGQFISQWYRCRQKQSGPLHLQHCPLSSFDTRFSSLLAYFFFLFPKSKARINNDTAFSNCSHPAFHRFSLSCWAWLARIPKASLSETLTSVTLKILRLRMLSCPSSYYSAQSLALRAYPQNVCGKCSLMTDCWLYVVQWF